MVKLPADEAKANSHLAFAQMTDVSAPFLSVFLSLLLYNPNGIALVCPSWLTGHKELIIYLCIIFRTSIDTPPPLGGAYTPLTTPSHGKFESFFSREKPAGTVALPNLN